MNCHDFAGLRLLVDVLNEVALALNTSEGDLAAVCNMTQLILVGDMADHESRASVFTVQNAMKVDDELRIVVLSALLARSMLLL